MDFRLPQYAPSLFEGILRCLDIEELYQPGRLLRQFGHVQGIPDPPPEPIQVTRNNRLTHYSVHFEKDLLGVWDQDPRPLIQIREPRATYYWAVTDDYLDWYDRVSHPLVDPRSRRLDRPVGPLRIPPSVDSFAVRL